MELQCRLKAMCKLRPGPGFDLPAKIRDQPYVVLAVIFFAILAVPALFRNYNEWEAVYLSAATRLWRRQDLYEPRQSYLYPPLMAMAGIPFTFLPRWIERVIWYAINVAAMLFMVKTSWRLAGGAIFGTAHVSAREHVAFMVGLSTALPYCVNCFNHQQTDLLVGAFVMAGCSQLAGGALLAAATWFGAATAMKGPALLWALYFVWHRRLTAAFWLVFVAVALNLLPDLVSHAPEGRWWLGEWLDRYGLLMTRPDYYPGTWGSALEYNQSLAGAGGRFVLTRLVMTPAGWRFPSRAPSIGPGTLKLIVCSIAGLMTAASFAVQGHREDGTHRADEVPARSLESASMLILMLLLSPMSSAPHFSILLLPGFCAARLGFVARQRFAASMALIAVVMATFFARDLVGHTLNGLAMWLGAATIGATALLAACDLRLLALRRGASP